jgi:hypothetical protein
MQSRLIAVAVLLVAGASACGGTRAQRDRADVRLARAAGAAAAPLSIPARAVAALQLDAETAERRGTFSISGRPHAIFVAPTARGTTCVLDVTEQHVGAGCSPGLFERHELAWTLGFEGGPRPDTVTGLRVAGVASARVGGVAAELSDGRRVALPLTAGGAFAYDSPPEDVHDGARPAALVALDRAGRQLDRVELPALPPGG